MKGKIDWWKILAKLTTVVTILFCGEVFTRLLDGYKLDSVPLASVRKPLGERLPDNVVIDKSLVRYAEGILMASGVESSWLLKDPKQRPHKPRFDEQRINQWQTARENVGNLSLNALLRVNLDFLEKEVCGKGRLKDRWLKLGVPVKVFRTLQGNIYPSFQFVGDRTYPGDYFNSYTTNNYGMRGPDITLDKPKDTIRVFIIGDSAIQGRFSYHFSVADYIQYWFTLWGQKKYNNIQFEVVSAARMGGTPFSYQQSVFENEVTFFEPDYLLLYSAGTPSLGELFRVKFAGPDRVKAKELIDQEIERAKGYLFNSRCSALLNRGNRFVQKFFFRKELREIPKPTSEFSLSEKIDEFDPDPKSVHLPAGYTMMIDSYASVLEGITKYAGHLVLSSSRLFAYPDLTLDPDRNEFLFRNLNSKLWPYTYSDIRRVKEIERRLQARFAELNENVSFLDFEEVMPKDPGLYDDTVHPNYLGAKVMAWVIFNQMAHLIDNDIRDGKVPKPDRIPIQDHPVLNHAEEILLNDCEVLSKNAKTSMLISGSR